jgi:hypothetical protein
VKLNLRQTPTANIQTWTKKEIEERKNMIATTLQIHQTLRQACNGVATTNFICFSPATLLQGEIYKHMQ